jgi:hypothetical protein
MHPSSRALKNFHIASDLSFFLMQPSDERSVAVPRTIAIVRSIRAGLCLN